MFERYEIEGLVGRGGMGEVYRALDTRLHRPVALKVIRSDAEAQEMSDSLGGVQRLLREARAAAAFNHANSVAIYELGEAEGIPYIAMEFVSGRTVRQLITSEDASSLEQRLLWMIDAAAALWAAHRAHLVHRDVKPGNIMVTADGVVKVLDFGLAKPLDKSLLAASGFQTAMGQVLGTPKYMAPEQLEGKPADAKADQYAFALVVYELLSGVYPGGPLAGNVRPLHEVQPAASIELSSVLSRMLRRLPADRFGSMEEVLRELRGCLSSLSRLKVPSSGALGIRSSQSLEPDELPTRAVVPQVAAFATTEKMANSPSIQAAIEKARKKAGMDRIGNQTIPLAHPIVIPTPVSAPQPRMSVPSHAPAKKTSSSSSIWIAIVVATITLSLAAGGLVFFLRR